MEGVEALPLTSLAPNQIRLAVPEWPERTLFSPTSIVGRPPWDFVRSEVRVTTVDDSATYRLIGWDDVQRVFIAELVAP